MRAYRQSRPAMNLCHLGIPRQAVCVHFTAIRALFIVASAESYTHEVEVSARHRATTLLTCPHVVQVGGT